MMKSKLTRSSFTAVFTVILTFSTHAKEGMWIPGMLGAAFDEMQAMGLKLSEEDLYDVNESSVKDAIALFGGGCTAELVSGSGLLFTNHHCGLSYIQSHSSLENDYITNGFWAMNAAQELRCAGLNVSFILRMDDVTARMLQGTDKLANAELVVLALGENRKVIEEEYRKTYNADTSVRAFNYGNQYIVVVSVTYSDVRLVGAPPAGIGKFGGDTDNWVWPRHTGDFSVFRVYAGKENQPAEYSAENEPYEPRHFFPINVNGVKEGDFSMVYGFPGRTDHLLTSAAVDYLQNKSNPMKIAMRTASLNVLSERMRADDRVRIQYTSKQSGIANAWKKWIGQQMGLERFEIIEEKKKKEQQINSHFAVTKRASETAVIADIEALHASNADILLARDGFVEYFFYGPELFEFATKFSEFTEKIETWKTEGVLEQKTNELMASVTGFYKDFDLGVEKAIFTTLTPMYREYVRGDLGPSAFDNWVPQSGVMDWNLVAAKVYGKSIFADQTALLALLKQPGKKAADRIRKDPVFQIGTRLMSTYRSQINQGYRVFNLSHDEMMARYVRLYREAFPTEKYWNDANSTLRMSYGKVEGSMPHDGMAYLWYSTSDGVLEKYDPTNPDFELPERAVELFRKKEFGSYASDGKLHIAYTASNHTTGGNSGSPALNADGHLVGINFDRSWESTMSDINYSEEICRNIMVDIRYVLWVIDVYANADYLLDEMTIVRAAKPVQQP